ncbi:beta-glucoside-specific PTS transporter subunit IIABC [Pseudarthrobacter sp. NPDC058329]|uniref:beta-glucoside-specific PTS transporter subunit IIABC n=1 Tax=Pseudarthrobacter sp. NPDC058329 TaxID=3346448 RepID=UPI0036DC0080
MAVVNYRSLAEGILHELGGEKNVASAQHCATRLRLKLRDASKANTAAIEAMPGVITVMQAGGQYQVVIGNDVPKVYAELGKISKLAGEDTPDGVEEPGGNIFNRFIALVSSIFHPIIWPLAGAGLLKAFLSMATQFGWMDPASQTYVILAAAADALFYFLPVLLAITAARRFKTNQFTSMVIAGALIHPSIVALGAAAEPVEFVGIPVVMMNYTGSVIPIIVAVWLQGYLERFLNRVIPATFRNFSTPLLSILVMVPLVLLTVGPVTTYAANALSSGITSAFVFAPWLAGAVMGGFWQVIVMFGLHWGLVPIMTNDIASQGSSVLMGPLVAAVVAQAAAALAVMFRSRNAARREVAGPAAFSGFFAGITEPAIYGVNLPLKKPFYFGIAGGIVGGAIASAGGSAASVFVFPSLLALPAFTTFGNFTLQLIGTAAAILIGFFLTFFFGPREAEATENGAPAAAPAVAEAPAPTGTVDVIAPVSGEVVPLAEVNDKVFSSGALGKGLGILSGDGRVYAPVSGIVKAAMKSGHAYGIKSSDGVEVLVHIGIDTVQLDGRGFTPAVIRGQEVNAGDLLAEVDMELVRNAGYDTTVLMVVTNSAQLTAVVPVEQGSIAKGAPALTVQV